MKRTNPIPCIEIANGAVKSMIIVVEQHTGDAFSRHLQNIWHKARLEGFKVKSAIKTRIR